MNKKTAGAIVGAVVVMFLILMANAVMAQQILPYLINCCHCEPPFLFFGSVPLRGTLAISF